jgi:hypothetical protein
MTVSVNGIEGGDGFSNGTRPNASRNSEIELNGADGGLPLLLLLLLLLLVVVVGVPELSVALPTVSTVSAVAFLDFDNGNGNH